MRGMLHTAELPNSHLHTGSAQGRSGSLAHHLIILSIPGSSSSEPSRLALFELRLI